MPKVVGVKFKNTPKIYFFEAEDYEYTQDCGVIVKTARGVEYGEAVMMPTFVEDDKIVGQLKPIIRLASDKDKEQFEQLEAKRPQTMKIALEKIQASGLPMKLVDVKYTFDGQKLILYFTAADRVDFRELVRELASVFHVRIELRQIGARDECKMIGGIGPCGRPCCCATRNMDYAHVSIKMAKNQGLALNPGKINGLCGSLMCCLDYENEYYAEVNKMMPKVGSEVTLANGSKAIVTALNQLKMSVTVKEQTKDDTIVFSTVDLQDIKFRHKAHDGEKESNENEQGKQK
ncbi:MAG: stage 0 sporulation family protein [Clostridia bacterium]|nr:stage 0 sporulation family protein [Clostridia bacterium]